MSNSLLCSIWKDIQTTIITVAVIVAVALIIVAMIRWENARPFLTGALALAWFLVGVYSAFTCVNYYKTTSQVYGQLKEHNLYENFNFYEYEITDFALDQDKDGNFFYKKTYATSIEFNGTNKQYVLLINNKPCNETKSEFGKLYGSTVIHFDDVDGSYKCGIGLDITFTFYRSSIELQVNTNATQENSGLLVEYFNIEGFDLRILNEVYSSSPTLSEKAV